MRALAVLPGGWAMISMPHSSRSFGSCRVRWAFPPPKASLKTSVNRAFTKSKASLKRSSLVALISRMVDSRLPMASRTSPRCWFMKASRSSASCSSWIARGFTLPRSRRLDCSSV